MAAVDVSKQVLQFKLQLNESAESKTVLKILQKLKELDITLDILAETGIGKTVNSLRKHKLAGGFAKSLVSSWKELFPNDLKSAQNTSKKDLSGDKRQGKHRESKAVAEKKDLSHKSEIKEEKTDDSIASKKKKERGKDGDLGTKNSEERHRDSKNIVNIKNKSSLDTGKKNRKGREVTPEPKRKSSLKRPVEESSESFDKKSSESFDKKSSESFDITKAKDDGMGSYSTKKNKMRNDTNQVCPAKKQKTTDDGKARESKSINSKDEEKIKVNDLSESNTSFEAFMSYDLSGIKKKKRSSAPYCKDHPKKTKSSEEVPEEVPVKATNVNSLKLSVTPEELVTAKKTEVIDWLHCPLPTLEPDLDVSYSFQDYDSKVETVSTHEATVFPGQRLNNKMHVYSGTKTTFVPTMMSLHQLCIRTLQNNIDMLYETGGIPFEMLEPVFQRCNPTQLLRIEELNPVYIGDTDQIWAKHCQREFRDSTLEEYECWREHYIRLSAEREKKLKWLTRSIVSAHSKKPTGRRVKLVNTALEPVRYKRSQLKGHGGAILCQPVHPPDKHRTRPNSQELPKTNTANSRPNNTPEPRKKTVAPMMAKTLKALKKQLGRR